MKSASLTAFALLSALAGAAYAAPADWTTPTTGSLDGVGLTMTGLSSQFLNIETRSYTTSDFSAAPLSNVEAIQYGASNDWTATFGSPIADLLLYVDTWRGNYNAPGPDPDTNYTFSMPFTILSGLGGAGVSGNTLTLPFDQNLAFYHGIIRFSGPITSLSVVSDGLNESGQILTFATAVPEPATLSLIGIGITAFVVIQRRNLTKAKANG